VAVLRKNISRHQYLWSAYLSGFDSPPKRQGVTWVRAKVPDGCETPACEHLVQMFFNLQRGRLSSALPSGFEVDMTVPESGYDDFARAIDDLR
jgi:hypothetical protein